MYNQIQLGTFDPMKRMPIEYYNVDMSRKLCGATNGNALPVALRA